MPYSAEISRTNPACFVFLVDHSGSMADPIAGEAGTKKADVLADAINRLLQTLALRCAKSEGVRDYFHVAVIGYGSRVGFALGGGLMPISEVANAPLRVEERTKRVSDGAGGLVDQMVRFPIWFGPQADGGTPMCQALRQAGEVVREFLDRYPHCFPPLVMNISDGEPTDGDPAGPAGELREMGTEDGNVLLFNLHLSSRPGRPLEFPEGEDDLPDDHARRLFRMSSVLPPQAVDAARRNGARVGPASRGFVFNADLVSVVQFLDVGTRVDRNLR